MSQNILVRYRIKCDLTSCTSFPFSKTLASYKKVRFAYNIALHLNLANECFLLKFFVKLYDFM